MALTKQDRDALIQRYWRLNDENTRAYRAGLSLAGRETILNAADAVQEEYFSRLPRLTLSRCPYTGIELVLAFDPWGTDGLWWQEKQLSECDEPDPPPTFQVLRGAVYLNGLPAMGGRSEAHIGPEVPYAIQRILARPTMIAVISSVKLDCGYTAFPIAYFATQPSRPGTLVATWRETSYTFTTADGDSGWNVPTDPWDFDLDPWIEQGKVKWINPGDPRWTVQSGPPGACPYRNLPGKREQLRIQDSNLWARPTPNNEKMNPFDEWQ
jgi:hypothetical protein